MPIKQIKIDNQDIIIKQISGADTIPIRHAVLRKGKPIDACPIPKDNFATTYHFGIFYNNKLVGVSTYVKDSSPYFKENSQYRLRAMGIIEVFQGYRFGNHLLQHAVVFLKERGVECLWFNARIIAVNFYKNNGFKTIGGTFEIPKVGTHYVMYKLL